MWCVPSSQWPGVRWPGFAGRVLGSSRLGRPRAKPVERLLARCIPHGPDERADAAIRWLLTDPSRLRCGIGDRGAVYRPAWRILRRYAGRCSDAALRRVAGGHPRPSPRGGAKLSTGCITIAKGVRHSGGMFASMPSRATTSASASICCSRRCRGGVWPRVRGVGPACSAGSSGRSSPYSREGPGASADGSGRRSQAIGCPGSRTRTG